MSVKHRLLHWIFGHKFYFIRAEGDPLGRGHNVYRCAWCPEGEEFTSGVYWRLYDKENKRVR